MLKKLIIKLTLVSTSFYLLIGSFLAFPASAYASGGVKKASASHYITPYEAHDTTDKQSGTLDYQFSNDDLEKIAQNDSLSYQTQGDWPEAKYKGDPNYDDHLSFYFKDIFPHNVGTL